MRLIETPRLVVQIRSGYVLANSSAIEKLAGLIEPELDKLYLTMAHVREAIEIILRRELEGTEESFSVTEE